MRSETVLTAAVLSGIALFVTIGPASAGDVMRQGARAHQPAAAAYVARYQPGRFAPRSHGWHHQRANWGYGVAHAGYGGGYRHWSGGYNTGTIGYGGRPSGFGVGQVATSYDVNAYATPAYGSYSYAVPTTVYEPVTRSYTVPVRAYRTIERTRYVPVTTYRAVTTAEQVPVTTYQTVQRTETVPVTVYRRAPHSCGCSAY